MKLYVWWLSWKLNYLYKSYYRVERQLEEEKKRYSAAMSDPATRSPYSPLALLERKKLRIQHEIDLTRSVLAVRSK